LERQIELRVELRQIDSTNSILHIIRVEIEKNPRFQSSEVQVRVQLGLVEGKDFFDVFQLQNHSVVDNHVWFEGPLDSQGLI
jgi:hypothetical protein